VPTIDSQYPHATRKPGTSPKARRVYAYNPPVAGNCRASRAKTSASAMAPAAEMIQPTRLSPPYGASDAGRRKTPEPTMLPVTIETAAQKPRTRDSGRFTVAVIIVRLVRHTSSV
jgi:hypothetical protein